MTENFTTYTEVDGDSTVTVAANTITWTNTAIRHNSYNQRVFKDFGAAHFNGDFTHKFKVNFTAGTSGQTIYGAVWVLGNAVNDMSVLDTGDCMAVLAIHSSANLWTLQLRITENSSITFDASVTLSVSTDYYLTVVRDDDGGANGTGQLVARVCTGNYYGEAGATLVDTLTVDCGVGEQNDFQYLYATNDYDNSSTALLSLVVSDLDVGATSEVGTMTLNTGYWGGT